MRNDRFDQAVVVAELVATLGPVPVGVLAVAEADQGAAGSLDLLRDGHKVAVATDDDHGADVPKTTDVLRGVQTELDVGAVLRGRTRRKELDQFDGASGAGTPSNCRAMPSKGKTLAPSVRARSVYPTGALPPDSV